jgi:hypothetical protein
VQAKAAERVTAAASQTVTVTAIGAESGGGAQHKKLLLAVRALGLSLLNV